MSFFTTIGNAFANNVRENLLTEVERKQRNDISNVCKVVKVVAIAGVATSVALTILSIIVWNPILFTLVFVSTVIVGVLCYDVFIVADRVQGVVDSALEELKCRSITKKYVQMKHMTKGTLLVGPIASLIMKKNI